MARPRLSTVLTESQSDRSEARQLTQEIVHELLIYDPFTGTLTWRQRARKWFRDDRQWKIWNTQHAGKPAFNSRCRRGCFEGAIFNKRYFTHRIIWLWMTGSWPVGEIDHRNRDGGDNRWINLRDITHAENMRNQSIHVDNTSGFTGVYKIDGIYKAAITANGRQVHLGRFATFAEAAAARRVAGQLYGFSSGHGRARPLPTITR